jgi:KDO2-lipid IV(A) lauroyltransferase
MPQTAPPFRRELLAPSRWPAWIGLGFVWLAAKLPYRTLLALGRMLGRAARPLLRSRGRIAARNLAACFPELDQGERDRLLAENLREAGVMLAEFALAWMGSERALDRIPVTIEGLGHLAAARERGTGVLLIGGHFSHLELAARLLSRELRIAGMYRRMDDAVFEWAVLRARLRYADAMFTKEQIRASVRYLRDGGAIWYAPDQDMRGKDTVFAPFFGVAAATITATHHLARLSGAAVIPFFHRRLDGGGYAPRLEAPLEDFPAEVAGDTARINACIERMVREAPAQYLWMHQRFKTRPPGAAPVY